MSITLKCPGCAEQLTLSDTAAGKLACCPSCDRTFRVPADEAPVLEEVTGPAPPGPARESLAREPAPATRALPRTRLRAGEDGRARRETAAPDEPKSRLGLILGLVGGGVALLLLAAVGVGLALLWGGGRIPDSDWKKFSPPDGRCSVLMPGDPVAQPAAARPGAVVKVYAVERQKPAAVFMVAYIDVPGGQLRRKTLKQRLEDARDGMTANTPGSRVIDEKEIVLEGRPGRQYVLEAGGKKMTVRVCAWGRRMYMLLAGGDRLHPGSPEVEKFFASFRWESPTPPANRPPGGPANQPPGNRPPVRPPQPPANPTPPPQRKPGELLRIKTQAGNLSHVRFSPDGKTVATLGPSAVCQLWDRDTGKERGSFRLDQRDHNNWVLFSPDGKLVVAWDGGGMLYLRDGATGKIRTRIDPGGPDAGFNYGDFSPDGKLLVVNRGAFIKFWDVPEGRPVTRFPGVGTTPRTHYTSSQFSADGKTLITGAYGDGRVDEVWDLAGGKRVRRLRGFDRNNIWARLTLSPDRKLALLHTGRLVELLDWATDKHALMLEAPAQADFSSVTFTPDSRTLVTGHHDGSVRFWELPSGKELGRFPTGRPGQVNGLAVSPDGRLLSTASGDEVTLWEFKEVFPRK